MSAQSYDWSRFKKQIFITADPQEVFLAWAVPQSIEQWFIAQADYSVPFEELALPPEIKRAVIVYQGELTPDYRYIEKYLEE